MTPELLQCLNQQYDRALPFVAYHKPAAVEVKLLMQQSDEVHTLKNYKGQGFVMAPYDFNKYGILIPGIPENFSLQPAKAKELIPKTKIPPDESQPHYEEKVTEAVTAIRSGTLKKVVLSRMREIPVNVSPISLFERLVATYPGAFTYIWYHPKEGLWLGATPETLLSVSGLCFKTMALAATQQFLSSEHVIWGDKEKKEQQFVVDTIREKLEELGIANVKVKDRETVRAGNLLHLKTEINGRLKSQKELPSLIAALHPTPAVCGLPRDAAAAFIHQHEGYDRGFYTGFLGELNLPKPARGKRKARNIENRAYTQFNQTSDFYVNLRCMRYIKNSVEVYVGGGITAGSDPAKEWVETVNKMGTVLRVLGG